MNSFPRLQASLKNAAPALSLVTTLGVAAGIYFGDGQRGAIVGFAQSIPEAIAPIEAARILSIGVAVGEEVRAGQVLATLDTAGLDTEIALAYAEKARIEAEVHAELAVLQQRLDIDLEALERELSRQREEQLRANAEVAALDTEIARIRRLVEDKQAILSDLSQLDVRHATVFAYAEEKPRTVGMLNKHISAAAQRRQVAREQSSAIATKLEADLLVAQRKIERLEQRRSTYVLRATHAGRVAALDKQPGEIAAAGDPIVHVVTARARVVACVPERMALGVREGDTAQLWVRGQRSEPLQGKTIALGPLVTELPARCWLMPKLPAWGREITIALDAPIEVVPGQAFNITLSPVQSAPPSPPTVAPSAAPRSSAVPRPTPVSSQPRLMTVPPALVQRSRFEPSGILTRASESRYLIVSDDTGPADDGGKPWIFAMSGAGVVDADPIPLNGVAKINDLEAMTLGDGGEIYLLSSQSYNKKGHRKPPRTALLRVKPDGKAFRVDGEVHLAEMLDADPARAAALGLPNGTRALNIEGMAFWKGSLYLGLKAPLDLQGDAMIWRITSPSALFDAQASATTPSAPNGTAAASRLGSAGFSLWGHARVDVEVAEHPTPGGISDLLFLPDGTLVITSTPSTAAGEGGALWRVDRPQPGTLSPRLVQRFPGLKPEGVAPSLSPGKLMVVFDAGSATPSFQEISWGP